MEKWKKLSRGSKVLLIILTIAIAAVPLDTAYGYIFRTNVINRAIKSASTNPFPLPEGGEFIEYSYFWKNFEAVIFYDDESAYPDFLDDAFYSITSGAAEEIAIEDARHLNIDFLDDKEILRCVNVFYEMPFWPGGGFIYIAAWLLEDGYLVLISNDLPEGYEWFDGPYIYY